jgi:hypothetical protein
MRGTHHHLHELLSLPEIAHEEGRRAAFRQSLAALAALVVSRRKPAPLEGLSSEALLASIEVARKDRLFDDLEWLSRPAAGAALFELAAALPESEARRDLGRRVLTLLRAGDASTFVGVATQLALTSKRALLGPAVRARVALALELPFAWGIPVDGLALALISRRELTEEWVVELSMGSLPSRRLAGRILERAAREAAHRARERDDSGIRVFRTAAVRDAWDRLLADREPLVYRHVASARGLLCAAMPEHREAIETALDPTLGPTEWRRGSVSLAASIAARPTRALRECEALLATDVPSRDPGIFAAMVAGLTRPAESEPEEVAPLFERLITLGGPEAAEALLGVVRELGHGNFAPEAVRLASEQLFQTVETDPTDDDGARALYWSLARDLQPEERRNPPTLRDKLGHALSAFVTEGVEAAANLADEVMHATEERLVVLEESDPDDGRSRRKAFVALRELDAAIFETDALSNLLALRSGADGALRPLGDVFHRLTDWLLRNEGEAPEPGAILEHPILRMTQLRTLLHLVDADGRQVERRHELLRERRLASARVLLARMQGDVDSPLKRAACAACARALDALVREDIIEVVDVVVAAASYAPSSDELGAMAEASMVPEVRGVLAETARLGAALTETGRLGARRALASLVNLADALPAATSARVEAFRRALLDFHRALESTLEAGSLLELAENATGTPLAALESVGDDLARFSAGARMRLGVRSEEELATGVALHRLDLSLERTLRGSPQALDEALDGIAEVLRFELPWPLAELALRVLDRIPSLPFERDRKAEPTATGISFKELTLPAWMPPGRVLGGFYVTRSIGTGAGGTVFVARRLEDRHDETARHFALKVPDYSGTVARTLSEDEFLRMFREEAGALLAVPEHPNIARFVTFDAGARPKPILVMELVDGPQLERLLQMGDLTTERALAILEGVACGLEAMHTVGVAHLDLKPSNIIVRDPDGLAGPLPADKPVLVDFGLSGRHIRPGCGTAEYGAPEVWNPELAQRSNPGAVDVYAFGCMAFEALTGRLLFDAEHEMAILPLHAQHDGAPAEVVALARRPETHDLAKLLRHMLRQDPNARCTMAAARHGLTQLAPSLARLEWPIAPA